MLYYYICQIATVNAVIYVDDGDHDPPPIRPIAMMFAVSGSGAYVWHHRRWQILGKGDDFGRIYLISPFCQPQNISVPLRRQF